MFGAMAVDALHVVLAHVDIDAFAREQQGLIHVAVFHGIAAAALEVTAAAVLAMRPADAACHGQQVDRFVWHARAAEFLQVGATSVMAHQAVDPRGIVEVEVFVLPAVAYVAHGAGGPVGLHADAEIVDNIALADAYRAVMPGHHDFFALPVPVCGLHDLTGGVRVAFQAGAGDGRAVRKWREEEKCMVGMHRLVWQTIPGTACLCR
jgi:hypothetical protein